MSNATRQIARAAGTVMLAFVLNSLMGLLRQILITRAFGTDAALDAFYAASRLPEILFSLIAGGALASAFIPTFTSYLQKDEAPSATQDAWQLASSVANLVGLTLAVVSAIAWVFAPQLVSGVLVPQFSAAQQALTVELLRIQLLTPVIFGLSGLLMGVLNAHQRFFLPALAPSMLWLGIILSIFIFVPSMGIHGLAWGAVLGSLLHLGVQLPALLRLRPRYSPTLGLRLPGVRQVGRLMAPRLLGVAVVQLNFLVNTIVASGMAAGSLAAITVAFSVMLMPQQAIGQAIAIAALPTFSAQFARGNLAELRSSLVSTLRGILFLALPASIGLILLRQPVVAVLFQRGEFGPEDTQLVAWALLWYAAGLVGHSVVEIASRAFYALQDTHTPVIVGVGAMGLNVVLSLVLPGVFVQAGWMPHGGLALANSTATFIEMLILLWLMRGRLGGLEEGRLLRGAGQSALASAAMLAALWGWLGASSAQPLWLQAAGGVAIGALVYAAAAWLLRVPELAGVLAQMRNRLKR
ncbi:MAG: murein biosynthesis integral membrane protein MurJ [Anaerolineales bacterium]|nr:murein biosynthesis integral membrane protein MurJ [Anaerolineales bacterium]